MINYLPLAKFGALAIAIVFAYTYVKVLKSDLEVEKANNAKLVSSIELQHDLIEQQRIDFENFKVISAELQKVIDQQEASIRRLEDKFSVNSKGDSRDIGRLASAKPKLIQNIINNATKKVNRCFELATGAEVKEGEKNSECSELINPNNL